MTDIQFTRQQVAQALAIVLDREPTFELTIAAAELTTINMTLLKSSHTVHAAILEALDMAGDTTMSKLVIQNDKVTITRIADIHADQLSYVTTEYEVIA